MSFPSRPFAQALICCSVSSTSMFPSSMRSTAAFMRKASSHARRSSRVLKISGVRRYIRVGIRVGVKMKIKYYSCRHLRGKVSTVQEVIRQHVRTGVFITAVCTKLGRSRVVTRKKILLLSKLLSDLVKIQCTSYSLYHCIFSSTGSKNTEKSRYAEQATLKLGIIFIYFYEQAILAK